jgi:hypothetical protein
MTSARTDIPSKTAFLSMDNLLDGIEGSPGLETAFPEPSHLYFTTGRGKRGEFPYRGIEVSGKKERYGGMEVRGYKMVIGDR